jgi:hypothetical protein
VDSKLSQVFVTIESVGEQSVMLRLENNEHEFVRYQIREFGPPLATGVWRDYDGSVFEWRPGRFMTTLEVRAVNAAGVGGPPSVLTAKREMSTPAPRNP